MQVDATVYFSLCHYEIPHPSSIHMGTQAAINLTRALSSPSLSIPCARYGDDKLPVLNQLKDIFTTLVP